MKQRQDTENAKQVQQEWIQDSEPVAANNLRNGVYKAVRYICDDPRDGAPSTAGHEEN